MENLSAEKQAKKLVENVIEFHNKVALPNLKIDWNSHCGIELKYQMFRFAEHGYFNNHTEGQIQNFLLMLTIIAKSGFDTAIMNIRNNVEFSAQAK